MDMNSAQSLRKQKTLSISFNEVTITLISKANKESTKRENYKTILLMNTGTKTL